MENDINRLQEVINGMYDIASEYISEYQRLTEEHLKLVADNSILNDRYLKLVAEHDMLFKEHQNLVTKHDALFKEHQQSTSSIVSLENDNARLKAQMKSELEERLLQKLDEHISNALKDLQSKTETTESSILDILNILGRLDTSQSNNSKLEPTVESEDWSKSTEYEHIDGKPTTNVFDDDSIHTIEGSPTEDTCKVPNVVKDSKESNSTTTTTHTDASSGNDSSSLDDDDSFDDADSMLEKEN